MSLNGFATLTFLRLYDLGQQDWYKIAHWQFVSKIVRKLEKVCTGGPRLVRFLGFGKNRTM